MCGSVADRRPGFASATLLQAEPLAQLDLAFAATPAHAVVVGRAQRGIDTAFDAHRYTAAAQLRRQRRLRADAVVRANDDTAFHRRRPEHALQHEHEVRQHLTRKAAFGALRKPRASGRLPGPRPGAEGQFDLDRLQGAEAGVSAAAEGLLQRRQARRRGQREVDRGTMAFALDAPQRAACGIEVHRQRLLAQHRQAGIEGRFAQTQVRHGRRGDVEAAQPGALRSSARAIGGLQPRVFCTARCTAAASASHTQAELNRG